MNPIIDKHIRQASADEITEMRERMGEDWNRVQGVLDKAGTIERSRDSGQRRYIRIVEAANEFSEITAPYVACQGKGCSHCCKMAVNITEREAIRIGQYLQRDPVSVPIENDPLKLLKKLDNEVELYKGRPCPMLAPDGSCTVYPVRPLSCILQHSLEKDPEPCRLEDGGRWVQKLNTMPISFALVQMDIAWPIGDIREFFP